MTIQEEQTKIENKEIPIIVPEKIKEKEISPEEFLEIANTEEQNFKQETTNEISELNSVDLDHQTFENIKTETGVEGELANINKDAEKFIEDSKKEVAKIEIKNGAEYSAEDDPRFLQIEKEIKQYMKGKVGPEDNLNTQMALRTNAKIMAYEQFYRENQKDAERYINFGNSKYKNTDLFPSWYAGLKDAKERADARNDFNLMEKEYGVKNGAILEINGEQWEVLDAKDIGIDLRSKKKDSFGNTFIRTIYKNQFQSFLEELRGYHKIKKTENDIIETQNTPEVQEKIETQNTPEVQEKYENKEVSDAFKEVGMPLDWKLVGMLEESQEHQGGRRGSGFTQASRYMADIVRSERSSKDFKIFDNSFRDEIEDGFFQNGDEDKLKTVDFRDYVDKNKLKEISNKIKGPGSKILLGMIGDTFNSNHIDTNLAHLPSSKEKMEIGTCTTAENYFFDYMRGNKMYGDNFENKRAKMNIFKDEKGEPLFMEKIGLGENHSAISLKDFYLNGIKIPAGSLVALQYDKPNEEKLTSSKNGNILDSKILQAVEFLRFTTLVVNPKDREQTFGEHLKWQKEQDIKGAEDLTLNEVIDKCKKEMSI